MVARPLLTVHLLNAFSVRLDGREVAGINKPRLQTLLAYILLHREWPISRQQLAFLFWPDTSEQQARINLRQLIHRLRKALPALKDCIHNDGSSLRWECDQPIWVDVSVFEELAQKTNNSIALQQAGKVYAGDLLPGFYDDWILIERERLNQRYILALNHLVDLYETSGDYPSAIQALQMLQTHDPIREETYRRTMTLYAKMNDLAGVHRTFENLKKQLEVELDVEPSAPTRDLFQDLLNIELVTAPRPPVRKYGLVDRDLEWSTLLAAWSAGTYHDYRLVLITGEAGVGKTRLAEELVAWAESNGFQQLAAQCYTTGLTLAYAPVVHWLRQMKIPELDLVWLKEVSRLLPELRVTLPELDEPGPLTEPWQRQRLLEALRRFLLSGSKPLLLVIDDLQWCDSQSLDLINYLIQADWRQADTDLPRLMVVATLRREELHKNSHLERLTSGLSRNSQLVEVELGALDLQSSTLLAIEIAGAELNPTQADWVFSESEGNPFFIVEIVKESLRTPGSILSSWPQEQKIAPLSPEANIPPVVRGVIMYRLGELSTGAHDLVELATVIGRTVEIKLLEAACDESEAELSAQLEELEQARILVEHGSDAYDFSHGKIRQAVYAEINLARRRQLHHRVADALVKISTGQLDPSSGQIAWHYQQSGQPEKAVEFYWRSALSASQEFDSQKAIGQLQKALELLPDLTGTAKTQDWSVRLHEALGDVYFRTGQNELAFLAFETALHTTSSADVFGSGRLLRKESRTLTQNRKLKEAQAVLARVRNLLDGYGFSGREYQHELIETRLAFLEYYLWNNDKDLLKSELTELLPEIEKTDARDLKLIFYTTISEASFSWSDYRVDEASLIYPRQAMQLALEFGRPDKLAEAYYGMGSTLVWFGDLVQAQDYFYKALSLARQVGQKFLELRSLSYLAFVNRCLGNVAVVHELAVASQELAQALQRRDYQGVAFGNLAWYYWRQEDYERAELFSQQALDIWVEANVEFPFRWVALWPLLGTCIHFGDLERARELIIELTLPGQMKLEADLYPLLLDLQQAFPDGNADKIEAQSALIIKLARKNGAL